MTESRRNLRDKFRHFPSVKATLRLASKLSLPAFLALRVMALTECLLPKTNLATI